MQPGRFVTLCFVYSGILLLVQYVLFFEISLDLGSLSQLGVGLAVLAAGLVRVWSPQEEANNPSEWGLFAGAMALLAILLTVLFLAQLLLLR